MLLTLNKSTQKLEQKDEKRYTIETNKKNELKDS